MGLISGLGKCYEAHAATAPEEAAGRIGDADVVVTNKVVIGDAVLAACPNLKLVCVAATGTNNVDLVAAKARGVAVCNVAGYSTASVTQHTICSLLNLFTGIHRYAREVPQWAESPIFTRLDHPVSEVAGKVLGVVGLGAIGGSVAAVAEALGMRVIGLARGGGGQKAGRWERLGHEGFFRMSDAVTLHCPLTPETRHLIRAESLGLMKSSAFLINTGRGDLVDEVALAGALRSGRIAGAAVDVLSVEPPPAGHVMLGKVPNLIVTPHTAWAAVEARRRLVEGVAENIRAFFDGEERNRVER